MTDQQNDEVSQVSDAVSDMQAHTLRCEYLSEPLGIDARTPRLSWELSAAGRGRAQRAYRVRVATSPAQLTTPTADLWESGIVTADAMAQIAYAGAALQARQRCWWTVQVWDEQGLAGPPSAPGWWEMGLLDAPDWQAQWIGLRERPRTDHPIHELFAAPFVRTTFAVRPGLLQARLYATARGVYEPHLNGQRVGDVHFAPGWTEYQHRLLYQTFDVTDLLHPGNNCLGAILGDGWYSGYIGYLGQRDVYGETPMWLAQLHLSYDDGTEAIIATDATWQGGFGPIQYSDLLHGERYDARQTTLGWDQAGDAAADWENVTSWPRELLPHLCADMAEPVRVTQTLTPKRIIHMGAARVILDFGQNLVGWVQLRVAGPAGTTIRLRYAEMLQESGELYLQALRSAEATDTFILRGDDQEVLAPHFTFHGFRYCEVLGYTGAIHLDTYTACVIESDTRPTGTFTSAHPLVNQLYQNVVWGQRGNFLSIPTDCPQRDERMGWLGDAQIFARTATFNRDVAAFLTRWLDTVADAQFANGAFPDVAPRVAAEDEGAPAWGDAGVILPWTLYQVYGDTRIIARHWEAMTRWMAYIAEANPHYVRDARLNNNYGDWLAVDGDAANHIVASLTPKPLLATAYYAYDARLMAQMARVLGHTADAIQYEDLCAKIKAAFQRTYVGDDGRLTGGTQTAYVLALALDLVPAALRPTLAGHLVADIAQRNGHLATGFVGVRDLLPVLTAMGYQDVAYQILLNETYPSWGYSIRQGATTIWERWDGWTRDRGFQDPEMNSFNHYSFGSVAEWLFRMVAGIDLGNGTPGYRHLRVAPHPHESITQVTATYHSISGVIAVAWETTESGFTLQITVPTNTTAEVVVPLSATQIVTEGGQPLDAVPTIQVVERTDATLRCLITSGTYHFAVRHD